jgi:mannose-6-phosphate isomerase-like protein (cupin superfamily)
MATQAPSEVVTPVKAETPFGAYVSNPNAPRLAMRGSDFDGTPTIAGALITWHALGDRTGGQLNMARTVFPSGVRPWFHIHHNEDEGFFPLSGQITVTVIDEEDARHELVADAGELVWAPRGYRHSFHVTSVEAADTIIVATPGNPVDYFTKFQDLELDSPEAIDAFCEESMRLYGLEFFPEIPLDG